MTPWTSKFSIAPDSRLRVGHFTFYHQRIAKPSAWLSAGDKIYRQGDNPADKRFITESLRVNY
jgi:hypothetical protein